jgi:hypothetical protein
VVIIILFRDLKKFVDKEVQQLQTVEQFAAFRGLPFWMWNKEEHRKAYAANDGHCCFNHVLGLPQKDGIDKPLYDYEQLIFESLEIQNSKHIWIKKATGLGISEFMLRFMAWLCLKDNALSGTQMCIVTGPRIE